MADSTLSLDKATNNHAKCKILINAFPKSGTHLLLKLFSLVPGYTYNGVDVDMSEEHGAYSVFEQMVPGELVKAHLPWRVEFGESLSHHGITVRSIIRDPRDMAISMYCYIMRHPAHPLYKFYSGLGDDDKRLTKTIGGFDEYVDGVKIRDFGARLSSWSGWFEKADVHFVRFEDLIGEKGGGDKQRQMSAVSSMLNSIGIYVERAELERYSDSVFDEGVHSFRQGKIGSWKSEFKSHHKILFKRVAQWYLEKQGYERDDGW